MNTATYEHLLLRKRDSVLSGLGASTEALGRVAEEDRPQVSHDEFVSTHVNSIEYLQLRMVTEALDRIRSGSYGACFSCEKPIPGKRLKALPWARYCVACQEEIGGIRGHIPAPLRAFR